MKEQLTHILDQSVCLSRKQMKEYLSGSMLPEETHAAEVHISSCPLCSMAMDGFQEHSEDALAAIGSLNSGFLKEHFDNIAPQIHLNSMAPSAALSSAGRRKAISGAWIRPAGIAAGLLLVCAAAWYLATRAGEQSAAPDIAGTPVLQAPVPYQEPVNERAGTQTAAAAAATAPAAASPDATQEPAGDDNAAKPARNTRVSGQSLVSATTDGHGGMARYYQPEPIPAEEPGQASKAEVTALPSANDASKIYQGDISVRTTKVYVPPAPDPAEATRLSPPPAKLAVPSTKPQAAEVATGDTKAAPKRAEESSDQLFERGEYRSALAKYRQQIRSTDADTRSHASLQAARCYAALGEPDRAEALLRKVLEEGSGRDRRTARKLLRNLH